MEPLPHLVDERTVVILYYKPPNVVTSHSNNDATPAFSEEPSRTTVYDDILTMEGYTGDRIGSFANVTGMASKLHAIGRLDAETTGLLLLTNDGGLVHHVTNPTSKLSDTACITKTYEAVIMGKYDTTSMEFQHIRERGVDIGVKYGGMTKPAIDLKVLGHPTSKSTQISITIVEGKNRQVRRMFHAINSGVMRLKRTHIGSALNLDGLEEGDWRLLTDDEVITCLGWKPKNILQPESTRLRQPQHRRNLSKNRRRP